MNHGAVVRLRALKARPELNGSHAVVIPAASAAEAAELELKGRTKLRTLADEVLSVKLASVELAPAEVSDAIFSTDHLMIVSKPECGYHWKARRPIRAGKTLLREEPLLVFRMADHLVDPVIQALHAQLEPYFGMDKYPPRAMELFDRSAERIAEREYAKLSATQKKRFMALSDAFSPTAAKTIGGIYRTNSFDRGEDTDGAVMYELTSRINHSCKPNVVKEYEKKINVTF